jgi:ribosomal protein S18 acetylase RimI-like enzyme
MDARVQTAHGDAWEVHGRLRAGTRELRGLRLMASGLPDAQYNNGDVTAADADIAGAAAFYGELPWGLCVPPDLPWRHGRKLFRLRLMGLAAEAFTPAPSVPELTIRAATPADLDTVVRVDAAAFGGEPQRAWAEPLVGAPLVETVLAEFGGEPVGTAYTIRSDGRAGPCAYLAGVGVVQKARRRGIAAAVSSWLLERAFAAGAELAHLHPDNEPAARVYTRLGFCETAGFDVYVDVVQSTTRAPSTKAAETG